MTLPRLLVLTDRTQIPEGQTLIERLRRCVDAGLTHVVLRELDLEDQLRDALAAELRTVGATVIAARRRLRNSSGLHLAGGQQVGAIPTSPDDGELVGVSCHSRADVGTAARAGARYSTLGPFALTASKPGYGPPLETGEYADLPIPTYALGGITPQNAAHAIAAGAHGVAVMGPVMRSTDPERTIRDLLAALP